MLPQAERGERRRADGSSPGIVFVHASWQAVVDWARQAADDESRSEHARLLLSGLVDYLERRSDMIMKTTSFDPDRMARVINGARGWVADLDQQHAAQETFFAGVAREVRRVLRLGDDFWIKIASRDQDWTPVSTYLELWWPTPDLAEMPSTRVWAEAYLGDEDTTIQLRSGLLLENRVHVAGWYGVAQDEASHAFGDRYWTWRQRGSHAEVWARQALDLSRLEASRDALVKDIERWVVEVLPRMAARGGSTSIAVR